LPDRFDLSIPQKRAKYRVHVRWRMNDQIGVAFEHAYTGDELKAARRLQPIHPEDESIVDAPLVTDMAI
jgi:hypothetical protein